MCGAEILSVGDLTQRQDSNWSNFEIPETCVTMVILVTMVSILTIETTETIETPIYIGAGNRNLFPFSTTYHGITRLFYY